MIKYASNSPFLVRLALAIGFLSATLLLAMALQPVMGGSSLFLFLAAVVLGSLYGGFGVALVIAVLATLSHNYFFQLPLYRIQVDSVHDLVELTVFLAMAVFMSWVGASHRKALATAEEHRRAAEAERRSREDLLAVVSHDLKNPLASIQMNAELIPMLYSEALLPEVARRSRVIQDSIRQMSTLIQDLLDNEKIRSGNFEIRPKELDLEPLMAEVSSLMQPLADSKKLRLTLDLGPPPLRALCDSSRILQVLSNLIGNAIKFTASGGSVELKVEERAGEVLFRVTDTGVGIPESQLPHVFDRYWQAPQSSHQGTGLGLAIARQIVEAHGGRIWATSRPGGGSSFFFTLKRGARALAPIVQIRRKTGNSA